MGDYIIGIDLGTSNSCVAVVEDGKSNIIPDPSGRKIQPSVVSFYPDGSHVVGYDAKLQRVYNPENTVFSTKRLIGRPFHADEVQRFIRQAPYRIVQGNNDSVAIEIQGKLLTTADISGMILGHMKRVAEEYLGEEVRKAVITVPANFNELQRNATKRAGELAGLEVVRVINEPTAAALAYGFGQGLDQKICIYDFGGGTFDMTVLSIHGDVFEVLSTAGDTYLGGDDIDEKITELVVQTYKRTYNVDISSDPLALLRVRHEAEQVKQQLSAEPKALMKIPALAYTDKGPLDLNVALSRENFNLVAKDIIEKTFTVTENAIKAAGLHASEIDNIILVGGCTNIPLVRDMVQLFFGRTPFWGVNPDDVVAIGAAIQGAIIGGGSAIADTEDDTAYLRDAVLLDVTPLPLGVGIIGGQVEEIIPRNTPLPIEQSRIFTTANDNQRTVRISVFQGDSRYEEENELVGVLTLSNLKPARRGEVEIEVTFEIDVNGILHVSAVDLESGIRQECEFNLVGSHQGGDSGRPDQATAAAPMPTGKR